MNPSDRITGQIIADRRTALGMTQGALLRRLRELGDVPPHQTWLSRVESGAQPLKLSHAAIVARGLGCGLEDLLEDIERPASANDVQVGVNLSIVALTELLAKLEGQPA